jgi:hypothetical protein
MRYRILHRDGKLVVQRKVWIGWRYLEKLSAGFLMGGFMIDAVYDTLEEAQDAICKDAHRRLNKWVVLKEYDL